MTASCRSSSRRSRRTAAGRRAVPRGPGVGAARGGDVPARLRALRDLGVRIAVDGFGLGWGAPAGLEPLPRASRSSPLSLAADAVKLDRRLVADMARPQAAHVVGAVVGLARTLGLQPIAEGVDTLERPARSPPWGWSSPRATPSRAPARRAAVEALLAADVRRDAAARGSCAGLPVRRRPGPARAVAGVPRARRRPGGRGRGRATVPGSRTRCARSRPTSSCSTSPCPTWTASRRSPTCGRRDADLAVIVLSGFDAAAWRRRRSALGADRYVEKTTPMQEIAAIVRAVVTARRGPRPLLEAVA